MAESRANSVIETESGSKMETVLDDLGWAALLITTASSG
jgi:hypothetical protein